MGKCRTCRPPFGWSHSIVITGLVLVASLECVGEVNLDPAGGGEATGQEPVVDGGCFDGTCYAPGSFMPWQVTLPASLHMLLARAMSW